MSIKTKVLDRNDLKRFEEGAYVDDLFPEEANKRCRNVPIIYESLVIWWTSSVYNDRILRMVAAMLNIIISDAIKNISSYSFTLKKKSNSVQFLNNLLDYVKI